ncbi:hypothetical protein HYW46_00590 [Candidatus Daviesbacteria bacterium]|nr:hypothetical protein [Candidatus Daviesbacteria bacterium]
MNELISRAIVNAQTLSEIRSSIRAYLKYKSKRQSKDWIYFRDGKFRWFR